MAATPSPNYNDSQILSADPTFINRVRQSLIAACIAIAGEGITAPLHLPRGQLAMQILQAPGNNATVWAQLVAANSTVLNDATVNGGTPLTVGNVAAQAALVT